MTVQTLDNRARADLADVVPPGVSNIVKWANDLATAAQAVELIVDTPFIPVSFWPLPQGVTIKDFPNPTMRHPRETDEEHLRRRRGAIAAAASAVVYGDEIGLTAQSALTSVYVVRGRPGLYAEAMVALVKSHGHEVAVEELTDRICRMRARRRGEQEWQRFEFTIDRARRAGYDRQNTKYGTDPQAMLYPRCASITCRTVFPDVLKGLAAVEELIDEPDAAAPAGNGTRTVQRAATRAVGASAERPAPVEQAPPSEALTGPPLPGEDGENGEPEPLDPTTWAAINERFRVLGGRVTGQGKQAARLYVIGRIVGRTVEQGRELTAAEGDLVLSTLQGTTRERLDALLDERNRVEPGAATEPAAAPSGPPLPGEDDEPRAATQDDVEAEADELTGEDLEPGADEGRPAALEGVADPWGPQ
jgi:hypothetical protein